MHSSGHGEPGSINGCKASPNNNSNLWWWKVIPMSCHIYQLPTKSTKSSRSAPLVPHKAVLAIKTAGLLIQHFLALWGFIPVPVRDLLSQLL